MSNKRHNKKNNKGYLSKKSVIKNEVDQLPQMVMEDRPGDIILIKSVIRYLVAVKNVNMSVNSIEDMIVSVIQSTYIGNSTESGIMVNLEKVYPNNPKVPIELHEYLSCEGWMSGEFINPTLTGSFIWIDYGADTIKEISSLIEFELDPDYHNTEEKKNQQKSSGVRLKNSVKIRSGIKKKQFSEDDPIETIKTHSESDTAKKMGGILMYVSSYEMGPNKKFVLKLVSMEMIDRIYYYLEDEFEMPEQELILPKTAIKPKITLPAGTYMSFGGENYVNITQDPTDVDANNTFRVINYGYFRQYLINNFT